MNDRVVIFDEITRKFIKTIYYSDPKGFMTYLVAEAFDFKTVENAQEWAEGLPHLIVLRQSFDK